MGITADELKALDQGSLVTWSGTQDDYDVPFYRVAFIEGLAWIAPNGEGYLDEALEEDIENITLVYKSEVHPEAAQ